MAAGDQRLSGEKPVTSKEQRQSSLPTKTGGRGRWGKCLVLAEPREMGGNVFS